MSYICGKEMRGRNETALFSYPERLFWTIFPAGKDFAGGM